MATLSLSAHRAPLSSSNSVFFNRSRQLVAVSVRRRSAPPVSRGALGCRCLFGLGVPELAVIVGVAALVFGPKKLPEIGSSIGKTLKSFQLAAKEFEAELKKDPEEVSNPSAKPATSEEEKKDQKKVIEASGTKESI